MCSCKCFTRCFRNIMGSLCCRPSRINPYPPYDPKLSPNEIICEIQKAFDKFEFGRLFFGIDTTGVNMWKGKKSSLKKCYHEISRDSSISDYSITSAFDSTKLNHYQQLLLIFSNIFYHQLNESDMHLLSFGSSKSQDIITEPLKKYTIKYTRASKDTCSTPTELMETYRCGIKNISYGCGVNFAPLIKHINKTEKICLGIDMLVIINVCMIDRTIETIKYFSSSSNIFIVILTIGDTIRSDLKEISQLDNCIHYIFDAHYETIPFWENIWQMMRQIHFKLSLFRDSR
jgi:hypothetical protein